MKSVGKKNNLNKMEKLMKMMRMRMKMKMKTRKRETWWKRRWLIRLQLPAKKRTVQYKLDCWHGFGSCFVCLFVCFLRKKKDSCDTNPRTPTHPKSQRIVPVTFHLPPFSPSWKSTTKLGDFTPTKLEALLGFCVRLAVAWIAVIAESTVRGYQSHQDCNSIFTFCTTKKLCK